MSKGWQTCKGKCPVCGHKGWCGVSDDGAVVHCMRQPSDKPCASGGWIHFLRERPRPAFFAPRPPVRPKPQTVDFETVMDGFRREMETDDLAFLSEDLWLDRAAVARLRPGRSRFHKAWAFPMLDENAKCVGVRLRGLGSSDKWSVGGSRDGLFYDPTLEPRECHDRIPVRELVVVEGATDAIAAYELGLPAVGRSSCATGGDLLRGLCARLRVSRVTVVADNDRQKFREDGTAWRPGIEGARNLAAAIRRPVRILLPPCKDLREWLYKGNLTTESFWRLAAIQRWRMP